MNEFEERELKRGDVYWVQSDKLGIDQMLGRPMVIVSNDAGNMNENNTLVIGLFITTGRKYGVIYPEIKMPRKRSWVKCNCFVSVFKDQIGNYMYTLTDEEMAAVEKGIGVALALNLAEEDTNSFEKEKIELLCNEIAKVKDESVEIAVERDLYKKMYSKTLEMLSDKMMDSNNTVEVEVEAKVEVKEDEDVGSVEINTCTEADLRNVGCTNTMVQEIIAHRPYKALSELKTLSCITNVVWRILEKKLCCVPVKKKRPPKEFIEGAKVNINTSTWEELKEVAGFCETTAKQIVSYRKKVGGYEKISDLTICPRIGEIVLKRYSARLEV